MGSKRRLQSFLQKEQERLHKPLKPFVGIPVTYSAFATWIASEPNTWSFQDVCRFTVHVFNERMLEILQNARPKEERPILPPQFIDVLIHEIGQDQANDMASIQFVSDVPGFERRDTIIEHSRLAFEAAVTLGAAYALKNGLDTVVFTKQPE